MRDWQDLDLGFRRLQLHTQMKANTFPGFCLSLCCMSPEGAAVYSLYKGQLHDE